MKYTFTAEPKSPEASIDYSMDVSPWLDGDAIFSFTVTSDDAELVVSEITEAAGVIYFTLTGGVAGKNYLVQVAFNTSLTKGDVRTIMIPCRSR